MRFCHRTGRLAVLLLLSALPLSACFHMPSDGPLVEEIDTETDRPDRYPFQLIKLEPDLLAAIADGDRREKEEFITDLGVADIKVGSGDLLTITVVEPGAGGLFTPPPSNGVVSTDQGAKVVPLPAVEVDEHGRINVPFAGELLVAGHSPAEIGRQVEAALSGQAITPHVMVSLQTETNRFTLSGAVKNPGLFKMDEHGVTLLDAIANAGGATNQPQDIMVQITRFGHPHLIRQQTLLDQPETNIHVRADDLIELYLQPRTYLVLGATNKVAHETLPRERLTLAEAIGKAGGLSDGRADSNSVYLFRFETRSTLERLVEIEAKLARRRGEIIPGTLDPKAARLPPETLIPVIYSVNLRSGTGIFLAHQVAVREKDMVFVPNTRSVQWQKWLGLYKESTSPITSGVIAGKGL